MNHVITPAATKTAPATITTMPSTRTGAALRPGGGVATAAMEPDVTGETTGGSAGGGPAGGSTGWVIATSLHTPPGPHSYHVAAGDGWTGTGTVGARGGRG